MTKKEFKSKYSDYRKGLGLAYFKGLEAYKLFLDSNVLFRNVTIQSRDDKPVSIKIYLYLLTK